MALKSYYDGTHRIKSPEETYEEISPFLSTMGITRIANVTGLDSINLPVVTVCRPNSKSLSVSQGKGRSLIAAKISALMESIEGYHAENIDLSIVESSYNHLMANNSNVIDVANLSKLAEKDFNSALNLRWIEGTDIHSGKKKFVPYECVHTNYLKPWPDDHGYFVSDSNGLASGNNKVEAVNHALCEVVERDALAIWQLTPVHEQSKKQINVETIHEEWLKELICNISKQNIKLSVWDVTSDINIPTYLCEIVNCQNVGIRPAYGSGTHLDKNVALSRAITEAVQSRLTFIAGARDDQYHDIYAEKTDDASYQQWVSKDKTGTLNYSDRASYFSPCLAEDQKRILECLEKSGIKECVYVDLTKSEFGISVVKVIVPKLEGITHSGSRLLNERGFRYYKKYGVGACETR